MTNEDVLVDRQYSHGAALTLRAYWAADLEDRDRIGRAAGLQLVAEQNVPRSEYHWPYTEIFQRQMRDEMGDDTEVRVRIQPSTAIWVRAPNLGPDWVQEIGRASCRERVGKYVELSGVAEALKKKN